MTCHNKPSRNLWLSSLALLCFAALLLSASCDGESPEPPVDTPIPVAPTETPSPTPTTVVIPSPTLAPSPTATEPATHAAAEGDGDDGTKIAVQQLFDDWNRALKDNDTALFHSLLTRELAGICGLDELQSWLEQDEEFIEEAVVAAVFLDVNNPTRAYAEIAAGQPDGQPQESISFPWPVAMEEGEWRAGFPVAVFPANICPYVASSPPSGPEGREREYPQIPGLDLERRDDTLSAVPGTRVVRGSYRTGNYGSSFSSGGSMSPYDNQVSIYAELETESTAADLVPLYREGLVHPDWELIDEGFSDDFGWFSWTVSDGEGRLWHGRLVVVPLHEGWKQVWLYLYSNDADDNQ
ncbi:MAG: hypothetical protein F4X66_07990 [Chloroflexi bacterium]|nr:hypothetical protein [Chloroflexota bacterium]